MSSQFAAYINPLTFFEVEDLGNADNTPSAEQVLDFMVAPGTDGSRAAIAARCRDLAGATSIVAAPHEPHILNKLVWPLRHAKASYMTGNFLGTIALTGMVSEMVAITYFDATDFQINGSEMTDKLQKDIWGRTFEKQGQDRRVAILFAYGVIDEDTKRGFDEIRLIRRGYLHLASKGHENLAEDAAKAFASASSLVGGLIGKGFNEGKLVLNPLMVKYLRDRGLMGDPEAETGVASEGEV